MTHDEVVRTCLAAWNNVPADHPSMNCPVDDGTRRAWLRVAATLLRAWRTPSDTVQDAVFDAMNDWRNDRESWASVWPAGIDALRREAEDDRG